MPKSSVNFREWLVPSMVVPLFLVLLFAAILFFSDNPV
jgi:hypothetical protein